MQVLTTDYSVEVFSADYQASGTFSTRGNPAMYVNDEAVTSFELTNATVTPLMDGARIGEMKPRSLFFPRDEIQILLIGDMNPADASLRPRILRLICFTNTYAIRGSFHVGMETSAADVFAASGPFFPATDAEIFSMRPLAVEVAGEAEMLFFNKHAVRAYYELNE